MGVICCVDVGSLLYDIRYSRLVGGIQNDVPEKFTIHDRRSNHEGDLRPRFSAFQSLTVCCGWNDHVRPRRRMKKSRAMILLLIVKNLIIRLTQVESVSQLRYHVF